MRKYFENNRQKLQFLSILIFFVLVIGVVTGSIFYVKTGDGRAVINEHFKDIFSAAANNSDPRRTALGFFIENAVCCALIFISAYFKFGTAISLATVLRKGFVTGFTAAAASGAYGAKGTLIMASTILDLVPAVIILVAFAAVSVSYSIQKEKNSKKFLIFFALFSISIFGVISLSRGFITTTFMKFIYPKMI